MTLKLIKVKVKQLKDIIVNIIHDVIEPKTWDEFLASKDPMNGNLYIYDDDLPIIRDIKAFLNMLTAIERVTEKLTEQYSFPTSITKKASLIQDYFDFMRNYKIYMATTSILTQYLTSLKDAVILILPKLIDKMIELSKLCNNENLEKAADFFIEQVIVLEQYQENYLQRKKAITKKEPANVVKQAEPQSDFISSLVLKTNLGLRSVYKDKYDIHFKTPVTTESKTENKSDSKSVAVDKKPENQPVNTIDYYPECKEDTDVIKHIKLLLNGVIGIKKVLDDNESYQKSDYMFSSISWAATAIGDLRRAYNSLHEFDYQAIIAEKSGPYTNMIKYYLNILNDLLERLACVADKFENEFRLQENTLLALVDLLVQRHNQITTELRINPEVADKFENELGLKDGSISKLVVDLLVKPHNQLKEETQRQPQTEQQTFDFKTSQPDYVKQKNVYYKARQQARYNYICEIDTQIDDLKQFLFYRNHAIMDIPYYVIHSMQAYLNKYSDIVCLESGKLEKYNNYLNDALSVKRGIQTFIFSQLEYMANYWGWTIHAELMTTLSSRFL